MAYRRLRMAKSKDNFDLKAELNKAVSTLTDAAQKKLKASVNPDAKINPTDPALLPYTAEVKNAVQVAQGTQLATPVTLWDDNRIRYGVYIVAALIVGYVLYKKFA